MLRATLLLSLLSPSSAPAAATVECMGRTAAGWSALAVRPEMSARYCAPVFELPQAYPPQTYQLTDGPVETNGHTTCRWRWVPSGFPRVLPGNDVPEAVVCTLPL